MWQWDWLMGGMAMALGVVITVSAIGNAPWLMNLRRPRWLAEQIGPARARGVLVAIGLVCIALGLVILSGWRPPWV